MLKLKLWYFGHWMWRTDSLEKTLMLGKIESRRRKKGTTKDEMVGWHQWLNRYKFEQGPGVGGGQGSLVCCSPWGHKESDMTERWNWIESCWDNSINQALCDKPRCMLCTHQSLLVCFPRHFTLTPVLTHVTFCIVDKFCNHLPAPRGQVQLWVFSFLQYHSGTVSRHLMKDPAALGFPNSYPLSVGWAENIPFYLHPGLMTGSSGGRFCLRKVFCQPRVCLAPSCNQTIIWPMLSACPCFCAYPPHPPACMRVCQGREEAGERGEKDSLLDCQAPLSPPGLNLQCPSW